MLRPRLMGVPAIPAGATWAKLHFTLIFRLSKRALDMMRRDSEGRAVNRQVGLAAVMTAALAIGIHHARAVAPAPASIDDVIQVLADLTAIDTDCRDLAVNFGVGLRYASDLGLPTAAILPTGSKRPAFEKALQLTQVDYGPQIVCGILAHHYSVALPGSVTFPLNQHGGS